MVESQSGIFLKSYKRKVRVNLQNMEIKTFVAKAGKRALTKARQGVYSLFLCLLLD